MPVVKTFGYCKVRINLRDHPPPHFHVHLHDGREAWVSIHPVRIIYGRVKPREIADVLSWARSNQANLIDIFEELQQ